MLEEMNVFTKALLIELESDRILCCPTEGDKGKSYIARAFALADRGDLDDVRTRLGAILLYDYYQLKIPDLKPYGFTKFIHLGLRQVDWDAVADSLLQMQKEYVESLIQIQMEGI